MSQLVVSGLWLVTIMWVAWRQPSFTRRYGTRVPTRISLVAGVVFGGTLGWIVTPLMVPLVSAGWVSASIDWRTHKLPREATAMVALQTAAVLALSETSWRAVGVGALIWLVPVLVGNVAGQVGRGDVWFAPVLGAYVAISGIQTAWLGLLWALGGAAAAACIVVVGKHRKGDQRPLRLPLGPFLWSAAVVTMGITVLTGAYV